MSHLALALLVAVALPVQDAKKPDGYLGIRFNHRSGSGGVSVTQVLPDTGAEKAGLKAGDVILKVGETPVVSGEELSREIRARKAGETVSFEIRRNGKTLTLEATLGARAPMFLPSKCYEDTVEGPKAALALEKSLRGKRTERKRRREGSPVDLKQCRNITELTREMWTREEVLEDFARTRAEGQLGVIVFLKTEFCCTGSRLCAVTTSVLEKRATPLLERFKVYGSWIKKNPANRGAEGRAWEKKMIKEYGFVQGPGARVVVLIPTAGGDLVEEASNAQKLKFSWKQWEKKGGSAPELEKLLRKAMDRASVKAVPREF